MAELDEIQQAISALEAQRAVLGDRVVDTALAPLREKLAQIQPSSDASDQQLKLVTVLFIDVVGSTRIGTELDPEDTLAVMDTALRRFGGLIEANGGRVLRFMGDGLKAVFGAPFSREDDAERAVRAGLALERLPGLLTGSGDKMGADWFQYSGRHPQRSSNSRRRGRSR